MVNEVRLSPCCKWTVRARVVVYSHNFVILMIFLVNPQILQITKRSGTKITIVVSCCVFLSCMCFHRAFFVKGLIAYITFKHCDWTNLRYRWLDDAEGILAYCITWMKPRSQHLTGDQGARTPPAGSPAPGLWPTRCCQGAQGASSSPGTWTGRASGEAASTQSSAGQLPLVIWMKPSQNETLWLVTRIKHY